MIKSCFVVTEKKDFPNYLKDECSNYENKDYHCYIIIFEQPRSDFNSNNSIAETIENDTEHVVEVSNNLNLIAETIENDTDHIEMSNNVNSIIENTESNTGHVQTLNNVDNIETSIVKNLDSHDFRTFLANWVQQNNVSVRATNQLLRKLRSENITNLPLDKRTLVKTPRCNNIVTVGDSSYIYFGIKKQLLS